jgi:two-component sensor histidine kinase
VLLLGLPLVILASLACVAIYNTARAVDWVIRSQDTIERLEHIFSRLQDAETAQRGYILTGEEQYLAPFRSGLESLDYEMKDLYTFLENNPAQRDRLKTLNQMIHLKISELNRTIALRKTGGFQPALSVVLTDRGLQLMDRIRGSVLRIQAVERTTLHQRLLHARREFVDLGLFCFLMILLLIWTFWGLFHEVERGQERERVLRQNREKLEQAQAVMSTSLQEKEVLLKEVHHRVKNNLQIITSLLRLQSGHIKDKRDLEVFKESQNRIRTMALIHEALYRSKDLSHIRIRPYVRTLVTYLLNSYGIDSSRIQTDIDIMDVFIDMDTAVCCGLIVNELVSNALKYAFPADRYGRVRVHFGKDQDQSFQLSVSDDGVGLPAQEDWSTTSSLGFRIVKALVHQISGNLVVSAAPGTSFELRFPATSQEILPPAVENVV